MRRVLSKLPVTGNVEGVGLAVLPEVELLELESELELESAAVVGVGTGVPVGLLPSTVTVAV